MRRRMSEKSRIPFVPILTILICSGSFIFAGKGPKIKFNEEAWNFGELKQGEILTHVFMFKNEGNETLTIKRVRTSCGCTAALVTNKEIAPGKEGEIKVTLNTRGFSGKLAKYIDVESNDPAQPHKMLTVSADIEIPPEPEISLEHYALDVGLFLEAEEIQARAKIKNKGELELRVNCSHKDASFFSGGKRISFPLKIPSGQEAEIEIKIPPRKNRGMMREYVLIKSNDPRRPTISLALGGYIINKKQLKELVARYKNILD